MGVKCGIEDGGWRMEAVLRLHASKLTGYIVPSLTRIEQLHASRPTQFLCYIIAIIVGNTLSC